jgi:hypothetical protein
MHAQDPDVPGVKVERDMRTADARRAGSSRQLAHQADVE